MIEIPTPRWIPYESARFGSKVPEDVLRTLQERAYTSLIWYTPRIPNGPTTSPRIRSHPEHTTAQEPECAVMHFPNKENP